VCEPCSKIYLNIVHLCDSATIRTVFLGKLGRAEQALETENAAIIIEQKIREAEAGHGSAKRGLAALIARTRSEEKALSYINQRISDLEGRTIAALEDGKNDLANDAAKLIADLENERHVRQRTLESSQEKAGRIRLNIEKTHRRLIDLRQGLITAKSIETERSAIRNMKGKLSANSAIQEGEAVLERLLGSEAPLEIMEAYEDIESDLSGESVMDRLTEAGYGAPNKVRPEDVLARFKTKAAKKAKA